jgi:hypothetical protein
MDNEELMVTLTMLELDYWACYPLDTIFLNIRKNGLNEIIKKILSDNGFQWTCTYDEDYLVDSYIITMKGK